tara:strand:- start:205 stop:936 length:732 start_codon:yes stop_codon:yes gene_type:complete
MKLTQHLILSTLGLLLLFGCQNSKETFTIPDGHVGMFGFGSLTSKKFIETGLLNSSYDGPFLSAHLEGYKRSWTFAWPTEIPTPYYDGNYYKDYLLIDGDTIYPKYLHYLNIREDESSIINGVLYIVPEDDLPTYDSWELGYERFDVSNKIIDFAIEGGPVFAYKALPEFEKEPTNNYRLNIIEQSYSNIIQEAFDYWGKEFEEEYKNSTEPIDSTIIRTNQKVLWVDPPLEKTEELRATFKY